MTVRTKDPFSVSEDEFIEHSGVIIGYIKIHGARFAIDLTAGTEVGRLLNSIPLITFPILEASQTAYLAAHAIAVNPDTKTPVTIEAKNKALAEFKRDLRLFLKEYITYNPLVTDEDRIAMRLPVHKKDRTPSHEETSHPVGEATTTKEPATLEFRVHREGEKRAKIIEGQSAVEVCYATSESPITDWNDLVHSEISTRGKFRKTFSAAERTKILYFAFRWVGPRGQKGAWSNIQSIPIP
jgi:hypothetical protein